MYSRSNNWLGIYTCIYYFLTTCIAAVLGIVLVLVINPGYYSSKNYFTSKQFNYIKKSNLNVILDLFR